MSTTKSLKLSDLAARKLTELPIPQLGGSVWLRPLRAGFVIDNMLVTADGDKPDISKHNDALVAMILESVVGRDGEPVFGDKNEVLSVSIEVYNFIAEALLAQVNPKGRAAAEATKETAASGASTSEPSTDSAPTLASST
jgi:hypothetical protein